MKYILCRKTVEVGETVDIPKGAKIIHTEKGSNRDNRWLYYLKPT